MKTTKQNMVLSSVPSSAWRLPQSGSQDIFKIASTVPGIVFNMTTPGERAEAVCFITRETFPTFS